MKTPGLQPTIRTELQRALYAHPEGSVTWLAEKLGVSRQCVGAWVRGEEKIPRRRRLQIAVHLEIVTHGLFDEDGKACLLGGHRGARSL